MRIGYLVGGRRILPSFLTLIAAASMPLLSERYLKFSLLLALHLQSITLFTSLFSAAAFSISFFI
jgi:hypothetical protein